MAAPTRGNGKNCVESSTAVDAAREYMEKAKMRAAMAKAHNQLKRQEAAKPGPSTPAKLPAMEMNATPCSTKSTLNSYILQLHASCLGSNCSL